MLVKSEIDKSYNGNPLFTDVSFDQYGPNKTLKQVTEKAVQPSAFLYDYNNSYLIADVKNAALADIAYSSFELNQPGNWTLGTQTRNAAGLSGSQSYPLSSSNTITKGGLTTTKTYIVSYWTTNAAQFTISGTQTGYPIKGPTINGWTYYEHHITGVSSATVVGTGNIDELRLYPVNALMTTYTYSPLIGITCITDSKNQPSYYEYDSFQRLVNIKDQYGNIVKHTDYHYQGQ
jgi:hypothetical protein